MSGASGKERWDYSSFGGEGPRQPAVKRAGFFSERETATQGPSGGFCLGEVAGPTLNFSGR
ncbi:MAG: hypothetical protein A2527_09905 [Candidatus Lambdaproteobacteria bacterium RIFOXYD2_FULL_50_16]|uniref:Uncharacterized protein n=1 Tax=Candidatus Lambdaproteobacteria bacterium RIFOXYD2_FULL_50_16 TaxID=1817772 RepID=A0A1F6G721_9PROT|nr:MAG: hypothetical protein A2527_09905 [Candidatus Lambdaproteobacteria bacterium RIFOXYD2_FULL_50_16]